VRPSSRLSPTGTFGDPTLATRDKGEKLAEHIVFALTDDVASLRRAPLPALR
jgi:creatinine amidohydrolase/Fe(II)-dependent formamide hydrolase-like protein